MKKLAGGNYFTVTFLIFAASQGTCIMRIVDIFPTLESDLAELKGLCSAKNGTKLRSLENNVKQTDKCVECFLGSAGCMASPFTGCHGTGSCLLT